MRTWALIIDTWREARARYTLLGFVIASTLFLAMLGFALNLDIVDGTLAAGTLFGRSLDLPGSLDVSEVVAHGQAAFAGMLYGLGIFLAVFATGSQVPHLVRRGTVDLYLTRATSRTHVLLGRFAGAVTLVAANLVYLCGGVFLITSVKTGVWSFRFLLAGAMILLAFLSFLGFMALVGTLSGSTPLSIMLPYALYVISAPLAAHERIAAAMDSRFWANVVHAAYWALPKTTEIGRDMVALVLGRSAPALVPMLTTVAFGAVCLGLAALAFQRKDF